MRKIRCEYKTKGVRFHFEFDPVLKRMTVYGPGSIHFAHEGEHYATFQVPDWWTGFEQAKSMVEKVRLGR